MVVAVVVVVVMAMAGTATVVGEMVIITFAFTIIVRMGFKVVNCC